MNKKYAKRRICREIRRSTGLGMPEAARIARLVVSGELEHPVFRHEGGGEPLYCNGPGLPHCCVSVSRVSVAGPRGEYEVRPEGRDA